MVFRGVIQSIFLKHIHNRKKGIFWSILMTSLLFGGLHLLDFKPENASKEISQFLYAIYFGVFFGAILVKTNKLVPIAIVHGFIDFVFGFDKLVESVSPDETRSSIVDTSTNVLSELISSILSSILVLPLLVVGLLIIKGIKISDISAKL
ncbi:MAG: CPBP family intramembrane glutamic endopeptidase [Bacteroidota bacterium]